MASDIVEGRLLQQQQAEPFNPLRPPRPTADERARIEASIGVPPSELSKILEECQRRIDDVRSDRRFTEAAKDAEVNRIVEDMDATWNRTVEAHVQNELRPFLKEEAAARAALIDAPPSFAQAFTQAEQNTILSRQLHRVERAHRVQTAIDLVRHMDAIEDVRDEFAGFEARGGEPFSSVARACLQRGEQLLRLRRASSPGASQVGSHDARRAILSDMRTRYAAFCAANPTATTTLRKNIEQREIAERSLRRKAQVWRRTLLRP